MEGGPKFEKPKFHYTYYDNSETEHREVFSCDADDDAVADAIFNANPGCSFESGDFSRSSTKN